MNLSAHTGEIPKDADLHWVVKNRKTIFAFLWLSRLQVDGALAVKVKLTVRPASERYTEGNLCTFCCSKKGKLLFKLEEGTIHQRFAPTPRVLWTQLLLQRCSASSTKLLPAAVLTCSSSAHPRYIKNTLYLVPPGQGGAGLALERQSFALLIVSLFPRPEKKMSPQHPARRRQCCQ